MKILKGGPNELISTMFNYGNKKKRRAIVKFDENGEYVVPESDLHIFNSTIIDKLENKGFEIDFETVAEELTCEKCGFVAKSKSGLSSHMKRHEKE